MKKFLSVLSVYTALSLSAMAQTGVIAYDNSANSYYTTGNSLTFNLSSGGSVVMVCLMGDAVGGHDDITTATYGSQALTLLGEYSTPNGSKNNNNIVYLYGLNNANTGLHTITFKSANNHYMTASAASYRNATLVGGLAEGAFGPSSSSPYTTSLTTSAPNSWIVLCGGGNNDAASTGATKRAVGSPYSDASIFDTNGAIATPGSTSMTTTSGLAKDDVHIMAEIAPGAQQPSYITLDNSADLGNNGLSGNPYTASYTNNGSLLRVCIVGAGISSGQDDLTSVTYNGTAMTLLDKFTGPNGTKGNDSYLYLYELGSPATGSHTVSIGSTNNHYIAALATSFMNATTLSGGRHSHNGPLETSPVSYTGYATVAGAWEQTCTNGGQAANETGNIMVSRVQGGAYRGPTFFDTNTFINPARPVGISYTFNTAVNDDHAVTAEIIPTQPVLDFYSSAIFSSSSSWDFTAASSGLGTCSNISVVAWDTTVTPYQQLTPSSVICDGSFNVTASFSGTQTGIMSIVVSQTP